MIFKTLLAGVALLSLPLAGMASVKQAPDQMSEETKACVACHKKNNPGLVQQWGSSKHYRANVGCYECHAADEGDKDAYIHDEKKVKKLISTIVSPKDCNNCHTKEVKEMTESHHAYAGNILGSLDNLLAEVIEGNSDFKTDAFPNGNSAIAVNGCWQCHGAPVKVNEDGALDPATWPNTGIGRINPDGSKGACTACHQRHEFSAAQARHPGTCGKCHLGPDHPQKEIYEESKHGIAFFANIDKMNLDNEKWVVGEDYIAAPTCATCHMSATRSQGVTHDVGARISWNNRPKVSVRPEVADKHMGLPGAEVGWEERRDNMKDVCTACHEDEFVENFYQQYDAVINVYNEKFGKPGIELIKLAQPLRRNKPKFSNKIDWVYFELWHHEGRRGRMGASMMAPDYTHWHGMYEVAQHFYTEFIPELQDMVERGNASADPARQKAAKALQAKLDEVLNESNHKWFLGKVDPEKAAARKAAAKKFNEKYK